MNLLAVLDLIFYLLAGVFLVAYVSDKRLARMSEEERARLTWRYHVGTWTAAVGLGLVLGGGRYLVARLGQANAMSQLPLEASQPKIEIQ